MRFLGIVTAALALVLASCVGDEPSLDRVPATEDGGRGDAADASHGERCVFGTSRFGRCAFGP